MATAAATDRLLHRGVIIEMSVPCDRVQNGEERQNKTGAAADQIKESLKHLTPTCGFGGRVMTAEFTLR